MSSRLPFAGKPAVFLDRDGVINISPGTGYVRNVNEFKMLPGVAEAVRALNRADFPVLVVSNQRGIVRGLMTEQDLAAVTERMETELAAAGARIDRVYYCLHDNNCCDCRKPLPGLFHRAEKELGVNLAKSFMVGDTPVDIAAGKAAGCTVILVLSGKTTRKDLARLPQQPDYVVGSLADAAELIISSAINKSG